MADRDSAMVMIIGKAAGTYQMLIPGLGTRGSLTVPEKRLSRWGS